MPGTNSAGASMPNKQLVEMLLRSRLFRDYENVFTKATGLPLALRPLEFWQLEHHGKTRSLASFDRSTVLMDDLSSAVRHGTIRAAGPRRGDRREAGLARLFTRRRRSIVATR